AFLAMLGHELRNPLGAIGNAVTLVSRSAHGDEALDRQLRLIERQVRVLTRLVNDLLDVSRVTSGKVSLQRETVDLVALVDRLVTQLQSTARDQQLHLSLSAEPGPLLVVGDPVRLEQVFTNLLGNALKYTPARGRIEVAIRRDGSRAVIEVADSGVGIPPDALPHIFELFAQADTSIDRAQGGMGIGLTLVQSLVHLHGGSVAAASDGPGTGSRFTVTLPLTETPEARRDPGPPPPTAAENGRHVLLVEDNADNRASLRELLEFCGYRVDVARTGREGVERALELLPDVALVDIGLPELDGYAVAGRLRAELGDGIQLIAITGYGQPEDVHRAIESGFDAHVAKPVDLDALQAVLGSGHRAQLSSIRRPRQ
ncbi:MAG TPA: ATP-binding protein, partial [Candidatus Limnocylindria bacterium]|nr:ATP-binding protein [Candidatus Limnocylindria bacterium]